MKSRYKDKEQGKHRMKKKIEIEKVQLKIKNKK